MGLILLFIAINDKPNKLATLLVVLVMTSAEKTLFYSNKTHSSKCYCSIRLMTIN